jgi:hypothetical protein
VRCRGGLAGKLRAQDRPFKLLIFYAADATSSQLCEIPNHCPRLHRRGSCGSVYILALCTLSEGIIFGDPITVKRALREGVDVKKRICWSG